MLVLTAALWCLAACDGKRHVAVTELPEPAQQFLAQYFDAMPVAYATQSRGQIDKEYEVVFTGGERIEFSRRGQWEEVDCNRSEVPSGVVPQPILDYVGRNYQGVTIREIERDRRTYKVKLSNRLELKFDRDGRLLEIDD